MKGNGKFTRLSAGISSSLQETLPLSMKKENLFALVFALMSLTACNTNERQTTEATQPTQELTFRSESISRQSENCAQRPDACGSVSIAYIVATGGPEELRNNLNSTLQKHLLALLLDNNPDADTTARSNAAEIVATTFIEQYETYAKEETSEIPRPWDLKVEVKPIYQTQKVITIRTDTYSYTGGAHGLSVVSLRSFDQTGQQISLQQMLTDTTQLKKLAEQEIRKLREIPATQTLQEGGFFIEGNDLPLPQNAALTHKGLLLYYNPYEIASYADGPTEMLFTYQQLGEILKPAYRP